MVEKKTFASCNLFNDVCEIKSNTTLTFHLKKQPNLLFPHGVPKLLHKTAIVLARYT